MTDSEEDFSGSDEEDSEVRGSSYKADQCLNVSLPCDLGWWRCRWLPLVQKASNS